MKLGALNAQRLVTAIYLGRASLRASCGLPGTTCGKLTANSRLCGGRDHSRRLGGLPLRSCLSLHRAGFTEPPRCRDAGALLPHRFTLTCPCVFTRSSAVCFLLHFPWGCPLRPLAGALPFGVPTFLRRFHPRPSVRLCQVAMIT